MDWYIMIIPQPELCHSAKTNPSPFAVCGFKSNSDCYQASFSKTFGVEEMHIIQTYSNYSNYINSIH